jgi:glutamyl-tRNA synthetase
MDMEITHVIRGDDHLNNTPRQLNMLLALGARPPVYAHLPMILGSDGAKLSKRHGAVSVLEYRDAGFLPEAVLNYLVRLGWSHGDQEIFSIEEMIALFDIAGVNKSASAFDGEKLAWLNQQHMMRVSPARIAPILRWHFERDGIQANDESKLEQIVLAQRERVKTVRDMAINSAFFFRAPAAYDQKAVRKHVAPELGDILIQTLEGLQQLVDWSPGAIHALITKAAEGGGVALGKIAQPLRIAVCGGTVSPPIDITLAILGKQETTARLAAAFSTWGVKAA